MFAPITLALLLFQAPAEPKLATLEGVVTHAGSQTPIRKAKVGLTAIGFDGGGSVETGDDGKFTFKDVKPGRYRITAEKSGYETTAYGAKKPGEALGQLLRVDPGAALSTVNIALPKHGVIAGKILDADSEPVQKALVLALGHFYNNGKLIRIPRGAVPVMSDDLGQFRIGQLPPGKYVVCAIPFSWVQPTPLDKDAKPTTEDASTTTCFPNVAQMNEGTPLEIKDGSEIPGIDIRLIKSRTVSVQGHITGIPQGAGSVTIINLNARNAGPMGNALNPRAIVMGGEGRFEFKNVVPGSYVMHTLPTGLGNAPFIVKSNVEIGDQPVTDLSVPAIIPFEVKAKINAEPGPELKLGSVRVVVTPADDITSAVSMGTSNPDGDLALPNIVPGRQRIAITGTPATHYVREIRVGDQVAQSDEIDVTTPATPLTISLSLAKGEIDGLARNEKGEPVPGAHIALIPEPRRAFRQRATRSDQNGGFKLQNVPPGDYYLAALDSVQPGALEDEDVVKPLLSKMKKVRVQDDSNQNFELTVLPQPESK